MYKLTVNTPLDSFQKRYFSKFNANLLSTGIGIVTISLATRALGPSNYGNFNFLTEFFIAVVGFFAMGTTIGFFTKLSRRQEEVKLVRFYFGFLSLIPVSAAMFISVVFLLKQEHRLWPGQQTIFIFFSLLFAFLMLMVRVVRQTNDAYGFTTRSEKYLMFQKVISIAIIVALFIVNRLNLVTFFLHHFIIIGFILSLWYKYLNRQGIKPFASGNVMTWSEKKNYVLEFYRYSHPLFVYSLVGLVGGISGRWLLQIFAGSEQQGFFSLAYKVGALIFLFTGSLTPLFTREFSIAWKNQDFDRMCFLFKKLIPMFYCIAAALGVFVAFHASKIGTFLGGSEYQQAGLALGIMAFYPLHQTYGQLNGSVFYATDQTKLYRNIGVGIRILGLLATYFFIAPATYGGLSLGASGIALSMIMTQFIGVNIQLLFNTKLLGLSFLKFFLHQFLVIGAFSLLAYNSSRFLGQFIQNELLHLISSAVVYFALVSILILMFPRIISLTRGELINDLKNLINSIMNRK